MRLICRAYTCPVLLSPLLEYLAALRLIIQPVTLLSERFSRPLMRLIWFVNPLPDPPRSRTQKELSSLLDGSFLVKCG